MVETILAQLDYLIFAAGALLLFGLIRLLCRKARGGSFLTWLLAVGLLVGGWFLVDASGRREANGATQIREAALGMDFGAAMNAAFANRERVTAIGYVAALLAALAMGSVLPARQGGTTETPTSETPTASPEREGMLFEKENLETLINSIDGVVWEADARTFEFAFVSQQCEGLLGFPRTEWLAKSFWKGRLHPDDHWIIEHRTRMSAEQLPYACEYRMIAADGRTVWVRESASPILNEAGEPLLIRGVFRDFTTQRRDAEELEQANAKLVDSSRHAGMAEVAAGVLHNVGNVLNSVNISGSVISERLRGSKVIELGKVAGLLTLQKADFAGFVTRDPRGPHIPEMISCLAEALRVEHCDLLEEIDSINRNISHIKEIVSMQQGFAKGSGNVEPTVIQTLVDDAIKINSGHLTNQRISVVQAFEAVPEVKADKHLVLQILVNLLRNAQQAIEESERLERRIVVKIQANGEFVKVAVQDSGNGIPPENLTRIFSHGYTTKKTGHGFGLHSGALAAAKMGGTLSAHSEGPGTGATFMLELPIFKPVAASA